MSGELNLIKRSGNEAACSVTNEIPHPSYDGKTRNDLMLLNMACHKLVIDMKNIAPARLPRFGTKAPTFEDYIVCGWGSISFPELKGATSLQCVDLPVVNRGKCNHIYKENIHDNLLCLGQTNPLIPKHKRKDSCQGDSGGGAYHSKTGVCHAIVMAGINCAD